MTDNDVTSKLEEQSQRERYQGGKLQDTILTDVLALEAT